MLDEQEGRPNAKRDARVEGQQNRSWRPFCSTLAGAKKNVTRRITLGDEGDEGDEDRSEEARRDRPGCGLQVHRVEMYGAEGWREGKKNTKNDVDVAW